MESTAPTSLPTKEERTWGMVAHLAALAAFTGIPFANILGPLIVWVIKKDQMPFVDDQGKESMNAQISYTIYLLIAGGLAIVSFGLLFFVPLVLGIAVLILVIMAAVKANDGLSYRYPGIFRFIK